MRTLLLLLVAGCGLSAAAQVNRPSAFHQVTYAIDTVFRQGPVFRTTQPTVEERALQTKAACNPTCTTLPVTFLQLKAERKAEDKVVVQWETAHEQNLLGYDVERSLANTGRFEKAGFVAATGEGNAFPTYVFPDANDFSGTSYYRIRQLDKDGKYSYSKTVSVKGFPHTEGLDAYPNPADNHLQLSLQVTRGGLASLHLHDATGRLIWQKNRALVKGSNTFSLAVDNLSPGAYFLRAHTPSEKLLTLTFVKK